MKARVGLLLTAQPTDGGGFQFSRAVMEAFAALPPGDFDKVVFFTHPSWEAPLAEADLAGTFLERDAGSRFFDGIWRRLGLPIAVWRSFAARVSSLTRRVLDAGCDLWVVPAQDSMAYQIPTPTISPIFDLMHRYESQFPEVGGWGRGRRRDWHYRALCRFARVVLVDSRVGLTHAVESYGVDEAKLGVLPFIPSEDVAWSEERLARPRRIQGRYFFYPAQFWLHKNHHRLVEALAQLRPELPDVRLVLVGAEKNAYEDVKRRCRELGVSDAVDFLGFVDHDDLITLFAQAHALVFPSFFGPTNIPPLEAFRLRVPVACSGTYGAREQLGDAALFFEPTSVDEIAEAMRRLWTDEELCQRLIQRGIERAEGWGAEQFNRRFAEIVSGALSPAEGGEARAPEVRRV